MKHNDYDLDQLYQMSKTDIDALPPADRARAKARITQAQDDIRIADGILKQQELTYEYETKKAVLEQQMSALAVQYNYDILQCKNNYKMG